MNGVDDGRSRTEWFGHAYTIKYYKIIVWYIIDTMNDSCLRCPNVWLWRKTKVESMAHFKINFHHRFKIVIFALACVLHCVITLAPLQDVYVVIYEAN